VRKATKAILAQLVRKACQESPELKALKVHQEHKEYKGPWVRRAHKV